MDNEDQTKSLNFSRRLYDSEVAQVSNLLLILNGLQVNGENKDLRVWTWSTDNSFSVKFAHRNLYVADVMMYKVKLGPHN
ncbi:hypothetical protein BVC80_1387g14 [Macleaya cordata]|uniref:Uncharacterized protein n=1 Tax=Macleaya cordata TaxID=56857 RepID=A0A200Q5Q3_MACCD|nr:hypothetical protein BVC80_1387g14 [Macleaya cordata]